MASSIPIGNFPPSSSKPECPRKPLILAAYKYGEPHRKRRVKVPVDILWKDFLTLFYSRFELNYDLDIEVFDENGIEIVSVDDLVDGDILVVREKHPVKTKTSSSLPASASSALPPRHHHQSSQHGMLGRDRTGDMSQRSHDQTMPNNMTPTPLPLSSSAQLHPGESGSHTPTMMVAMPTLSHFIQSNSFGHYFLAEAENLKVKVVPGKSRKVYCVIKVPHINLGGLLKH